ncbi:hypothetical protein CAPTEDRAFT_199038 [Capitella teleta]|uniref:SUEL-type lectin domain-containing protein n=1 Tax=Capitella teleta TaxID=283909 RepID=R7T3A7_CAPTE|nr:hypothetical protein CAPTEDRAFT_199038 [Capitella teleta]|eukprot:ELT87113.1 hypothetical protein CAPTEDRAFT_199038 [Capitella teleta]
MDFSAIILDIVCCLLFIRYTWAFQVTTVQTCYEEVFQARCSFSQQLLVTHGRYGHIEVSRCVDDVFETFGSLGCYANITDIIGLKCNSKNRCDIQWNDPEIVASKSCKKGLPMYMDTSYVCIPDTYDVQDCGTISVNRQMRYLLSKDVWDHHCFYDLEQKVNVDFSTEPNLKIKMHMQQILDTTAVTYDEEIYVTYGDGERLSLHEESSEIESSHLTLTFINKHMNQLIGFQAFSYCGEKGGVEKLLTFVYPINFHLATNWGYANHDSAVSSFSFFKKFVVTLARHPERGQSKGIETLFPPDFASVTLIFIFLTHLFNLSFK